MSDSIFKAVFPPPLPQGGTIGVFSPSRYAEPAWFEEMKKRVEAEGYKLVVHQQNSLRKGWLAGDEKSKAAALMELFLDPKIDAIMCVRGGMGALCFLDLLDYDVIAKNPKPFIGFSDVTCLLSAITKKTGMVTYHGPMGWNFIEENFVPQTGADFFKMIGAGVSCKELSFPQASIVRGGDVNGILLGGNMSLLQCLAGTSYDLNVPHSILFIEDVAEPLYRIDRMMTHLRMAGKFESVQAVLVGEMVNIKDATPNPSEPADAWYGKGIEEIMLDHLPSDIPVAFNIPCGHRKYTTTFPVGAEVNLSLASTGVSMSFTA